VNKMCCWRRYGQEDISFITNRGKTELRQKRELEIEKISGERRENEEKRDGFPKSGAKTEELGVGRIMNVPLRMHSDEGRPMQSSRKQGVLLQ